MKIFSIAFFLALFTNALFAQIGDYQLVKEYFEKNPRQKDISSFFKNIVKNLPIALKSKQEKPVKIVIVYPGRQVSDYWRRSKVSFQKRLDELGIKYEMKDYFTKPAVEIKEQAKQILSAIKEDADYLIFTLDAKKHTKFIERVLSRRKPKLILQNITTPKISWGSKQPFLYIGFDHVEGSLRLAEYYLRKTQGIGNYAVLFGSNGYVSYMRGYQFIKYLKKNSDLKLLETYYTDFDREKAKNAVLDLLKRHKNLKFIYACSTDIAIGAIEALKEKGMLSKIAINGWGGGSSELEAIKKREMDVTVMRMNDDNGVAMAEAIKLDLEGRGDKVPLIYSGDFELVEKDISKSRLDELKKRAFRYSGF